MKNTENKEPDTTKFPDSVNYPPSEDIYNQDKEETEIDPEDITQKKTAVANSPKSGNTEFPATSDLDVPGAELDDAEEAVGSEDEENNYYSIGGDDHNDLEEDKSEV